VIDAIVAGRALMVAAFSGDLQGMIWQERSYEVVICASVT